MTFTLMASRMKRCHTVSRLDLRMGFPGTAVGQRCDQGDHAAVQEDGVAIYPFAHKEDER